MERGLSIVIGRKKDGTKRWTLECRPVNKLTIPDSFPLPLIGDMFNYLKGKKYFMGLDFCDGFWALEVDEDHRDFFTFATRTKLYRWCKMPQG